MTYQSSTSSQLPFPPLASRWSGPRRERGAVGSGWFRVPLILRVDNRERTVKQKYPIDYQEVLKFFSQNGCLYYIDR
jgi:hypothetical protein